jgi:hypothetical protein
VPGQETLRVAVGDEANVVAVRLVRHPQPTPGEASARTWSFGVPPSGNWGAADKPTGQAWFVAAVPYASDEAAHGATLHQLRNGGGRPPDVTAI